MSATASAVRRISERLSATMNGLIAANAFGPRVHAVYNPLDYARPMWEAYLKRYLPAAPLRTLFLGMNPGPWGMAQTGIPFGEVAAVRDWLQLSEPIGKPAAEHPRRPIVGLRCTRSEVSGRRLWGLIRHRYCEPEHFFADQFVLNYCPLVFMADGGGNITPTQLPAAAQAAIRMDCDEALAATVAALRPTYAVGVGAYAAEALTRAAGRLETAGASPPQVVRLLHPSPASPAANRGWEEIALAQLLEAGVWAP